ncbi:MAG: hypothetical protein HUJ61_07115 [Bacilli bacterium]|nr:hypothetical protein [Bacilli bacterium]
MVNNIENKMRELANKIHYKFTIINNLAEAMNSTKIVVPGKSKKKKEYSNQALATVGDSILKALIADDLYKNGIKTKGQITKYKIELENNKTLYDIVIKEGIINFAYNDKHFYSKNNPQHEMVASSKHDTYLEAIVGAVFHDGGFDKTRQWFNIWLNPLLKKYRKKEEVK